MFYRFVYIYQNKNKGRNKKMTAYLIGAGMGLVAGILGPLLVKKLKAYIDKKL